MISWLTIILIVAGALALFMVCSMFFAMGFGVNFRVGSIPMYDIVTGDITHIDPKSIRESETFGCIRVKRVGIYGFPLKEINVLKPFIESDKRGRPICAFTPSDAYIEHVIGVVKVRYADYEMAVLTADEYKRRYEQSEHVNNLEIHTRVDERAKQVYDHLPTPFIAKNKGNNNKQGGGGFDQGKQGGY